MKRLRLFIVLGIALLSGGQSLYSQKANKEQEQAKVKEMLDSGRFTIQVNRALPMSGRAVNLTSLYSIELKNDTVISHLPYFGRAYSIPYGGGDGLHFSVPVTDYSISYNKKNRAQINFNARNSEDNYAFSIQVFPNGTATVNVTPVNRQSITYQGELIPDEKGD